jgi:energy-coupling factor transport system ATP-binding protein
MADGELIAEGTTVDLLTSSIAYAPQLAKVFAPAHVLTAADIAGSVREPISEVAP